MSSTTTTTEKLTLRPDVDTTESYGKLRYVPAGHTPVASPHNFHLPAISEFGDVRLLPLHDMRPLTVDELPKAGPGAAQLSTHGFAAVRHPSTMHSAPYSVASWKDPNLLVQIYVPETEDMIKRITGAKTVITEGLLIRSAIWTEADALATHGGHGEEQSEEQRSKAKALSELETGFPQFIGFNPSAGGASPAPKIHLDYAPSGARMHLRKYHPKLTTAAKDIIAGEDRLTSSGVSLKEEYSTSDGCPRWALFSIWRPLKHVKRDPLALGDQRTFTPEDYIPVDVKTPVLGVPGTTETFNTESYIARYSPGHKWYWIKEQAPEEVLVIGLFDSRREGDTLAAGGTLHSSVDLEGTEDEEARESLELRCLAIW